MNIVSETYNEPYLKGFINIIVATKDGVEKIARQYNLIELDAKLVKQEMLANLDIAFR